MSTAGPASIPPPDDERRHAVVLVHGAWVGEWSWQPVIPGLRASGRPVHAVSLTGHGAKRHHSGPHVTLADHVDDVVNLIEVHDLVDVTLVGHSYGGRVITQAAPRVADRLRAMVFLDAHTPVAEDSGQSPERQAAADRNGGMLPFAEVYSPNRDLMGDDGVAWFLERVMPQSFACLSSSWIGPLPDHVTKTFVFASGYGPSRFAHYAEICRADADWRYHDLDGPHFLMLSHPQECVDIILGAAAD